MTERQPRTTKVKELVLKAKKKIDGPYTTRQALTMAVAAGGLATITVFGIEAANGTLNGEKPPQKSPGVEKVVFPGIK